MCPETDIKARLVRLAKLSPGIHYPVIKGVRRKVKVLRTGKWKFMKMPKRRQSKPRKTVKSRKTRKYVSRRTYTTPKRNNSRRSFFSIQTVFKFIRIGAFFSSGLIRYDQVGGSTPARIGKVIGSYGGLDTDGNFKWGLLAKMWAPYLGAVFATYGIPKLAGIIRRL